jgi:hypothetical protein
MRIVPRLISGKDFALLLSNDQSFTEHYTKGLWFLAGGLWFYFFWWVLSILLFKRMGAENVGFLSGAPFENSPSGEKGMVTSVRIAFILSALVFMIFSVILGTLGVSNLNEADQAFGDFSQVGNAPCGKLCFRDIIVADLGSCSAYTTKLEMLAICQKA